MYLIKFKLYVIFSYIVNLTTAFTFHILMHSREIIDVFWCDKNLNFSFFSDNVFARSFKLHGYDLVCDVQSHARTDDIDLVSRSQVCHNANCKLLCLH